jgi:NitT/TauT family transport system substrate-binding protein
VKFNRAVRRFPAVAALVAATVAIGACGSDDESSSPASGDGGGDSAEVKKVRGALLPTGTHLPIMVAKDEGIFERNGIDMKLTVIQNIATIPGVLGRQFEFGSATLPDVIKANQQGIEVSVTSGLSIETAENVTIGLLAGPKSNIKTAKDLEGKKVGVVALGGNIHTSTLYWLQQEGADAEKVDFIEVPPPNQPDQLKSGDIDAVETLEPFRGAMLKAGATQVVDPMLEVSDPASVLSWGSQTKWAQDNPETVAAVRKSLQEAMDFIKSDEARAREILAKYSGLPPEIANNVPLQTYSPDVPEGEVEAWAKLLQDIGQLKGSPEDVDPAKIVFATE